MAFPFKILFSSAQAIHSKIGGLTSVCATFICSAKAFVHPLYFSGRHELAQPHLDSIVKQWMQHTERSTFYQSCRSTIVAAQ